MFARIETKVIAATAGGGIGAAIAKAALWALGVYGFGAPHDSAHADAAVQAVPEPVSTLITVGVAALGALIFGYRAAPSNHAGNASSGLPMPDADAGHAADPPVVIVPTETPEQAAAHVAGH